MSRVYSANLKQYVDAPMVVYQYGYPSYPGYQYPVLPSSQFYPQLQFSPSMHSAPVDYSMYNRRRRVNLRCNKQKHRSKNSISNNCSRENSSDQSRLDENNLYVKGLWKDCTQTDLDDLFKRFGVIHRSRVWGEGVGFVRFEHRESALKAIAQMNGVQADPRCPEPLLVKFAFKKSDESKKFFNNGPEQLEMIMNKNTNNVYIRCLPRGFTQEQLQKLCEPFGTLTCMRLRDLGVAFVRYKNPQDAQKAINGLNGKLLSGASEPLLTKLANSDPFQPKIGFRSNDSSEDKSTELPQAIDSQIESEEKQIEVASEPTTVMSNHSYYTQPNSLLSVQSHSSAVAGSSVPVVRIPRVAPISYVTTAQPYYASTQQVSAIPFAIQSATAPSIASPCSTSCSTSCSTGSAYPSISASSSSVASTISVGTPIVAKQTASGPTPKVAPCTRKRISLKNRRQSSSAESTTSSSSSSTKSIDKDAQKSSTKTQIYAFVEQQNAKWASKVTGMILQDNNHDDIKLKFLLSDTSVLQQKVDEAVKYLEGQTQELTGGATPDLGTFGTTLSPIGNTNVAPMCQFVYVYPQFQ